MPKPASRLQLHRPQLLVCICTLFTGLLSAQPNDALYSELLRDHVQGPEIDYGAIAGDARLDAYLRSLAETDPAALPSREARLALWLNAYNAYTLKLITSVYPVDTIRRITAVGETGKPDEGKPWDLPLAVVGGKAYTLEQIEHEIIRPTFRDPRIHFALVCAAVSCPKLRREPFAADRLDAQLDDQGRWFLKHRNTFDARRRIARLSQIFRWFADDFGPDQAMRLDFIADFVSPAVAKSLRADPDSWQVSYLDYDWGLNDRR